jgi:hypothetical protein
MWPRLETDGLAQRNNHVAQTRSCDPPPPRPVPGGIDEQRALVRCRDALSSSKPGFDHAKSRLRESAGFLLSPPLAFDPKLARVAIEIIEI